MRLAEMCRKLETEEEKVLPFYACSLTAEEQEDIDAAVQEPPGEKLANVSTFTNCIFFLYHVNFSSKIS